MKTYTVSDDGEIRTGTPEEILEAIINKPSAVASDISSMSVDSYANTLIKNAPYFIPEKVYRLLKDLPFETDAEKALVLLTQMPSSGTVIIPDANNWTTAGRANRARRRSGPTRPISGRSEIS